MSANSHIHRSSIASENLSGKASRTEDKLAVCESPEGETLDQLCSRLAASAHAHKSIHDWPRESLRWCAEAGVYRWFMPKQSGGFGWNEADQTRGYLKLAAADLTTTFIITQYMGACRRIAGSSNPYQAMLIYRRCYPATNLRRSASATSPPAAGTWENQRSQREPMVTAIDWMGCHLG